MPTAYVTGLENKYYFINNPIWVNMNYMGGKVAVRIKQNNAVVNQALFTTPYTGSSYKFDITPLIKSVFKYPELPAFSGNTNGIENSIEKLDIEFEALDTATTQVIVNKYFVRGGYFSGINLSPTEGMLLSDTDKIPVWNGLPVRAYKLNNGNIDEVIPDYDEMKIMSNPNCDSIYLAFLNGKGGFSYWNFEKWEINQNSENSEAIQGEAYIDRHVKSFHQIGSQAKSTLKVTSRFRKEFFEMARGIAKAQSVYVYKLHNKVKNFPNASDWVKIKNTGNKYKTKSLTDMQELSFNFDLATTEDNSLLW